jgi:predicted component of type VI protein secretion system
MIGFITSIKNLLSNVFQKKKIITENIQRERQINNNIKIEEMAKKTVITKVLEVNTNDAIIEFPQNRTLMIEQLTDTSPAKAEMQRDFSTLQDIFEHYRPSIKNIELENVGGKEVKEDLAFNELKDFEPDSILKNSQFLSSLKMTKDSYDKIEQQLVRNKALREALNDSDTRKNLISSLQSLLAELQQNN